MVVPTLRSSVVFLVLLIAACATTPKAVHVSRLASVSSWAAQLQGLERPGAVAALSQAPVELLVVDAADTVRGQQGFPIQRSVARMQRTMSGDRRFCVAYLNIGQAEDYRLYWQRSWRAPATGAAGSPDFMVTIDPDGWQGNYPVAYWDQRWQRILFGSPDAMLDRILANGFDGIYLDWVLGYCEPAVAAAAKRDGVDPAKAMVDLILLLRDYARKQNPEFVLIAQNGVGLLELDERFASAVDAVSQEDLSYRGDADAKWGERRAGGLHHEREFVGGKDPLQQALVAARERGLPVFTMDYAVTLRDARRAFVRSRSLGFVPFVSQTPLDRLPAMPPR